jgi:predicted small metal-binding protein
MNYLKCTELVEEGCDYVAKANTKDEVVGMMMQHGGEIHADLMTATTEEEMKRAKDAMENKMFEILNSR